MARTLADLTLKLSRDLTALEARCTKRKDEIEAARDHALMQIRSARTALKSYNKGLADAKAAQMKAVQSANELRDNEIRAAEEKRRRAAFTAEQKYRRAKDRAFRTRQSKLGKAEKKWKAERRKISLRPLTEQRALRKATDERYEQSLEKIRETYQEQIEQARLVHQAALQDILSEERLAYERANQVADRMITSAVVAYERAVAQEEARLRTELAKNPETNRIQVEHDRGLFQTQKECERRREALFRKFTQDRKKLPR